MRKIRIISGGYGLRTGTRVTLKDKYSAPFDVDDNEAKRLVSLGVAECVDTRIATPASDDLKQEAGENSPEKETPAEGVLEGSDDRPVYGPESKVSELRAIADSVGIKFRVGTTKEEMIAVLDDHFFDGSVPNLTAENPVN